MTEALSRRLEESAARWATRLGLPCPCVEAPRSTLVALARAEAEARSRGLDAWADALLEHHLDLIPGLLLQQQASRDAAVRRVWDEPTTLATWPTLGPALGRLAAWLDRAGVPREACPALPRALEETPQAQGRDLYPHTCFGRSLPMLLLYGARPALIAAQAGADPAPVWDRWLAGAWLHELGHMGRRRDALFPYLDEAIAGYLGLRLLPDAVLAPPARPSPLAGWMPFVLVGQALARLWGEDALLRAQAGVVSWEATLGAEVCAALERRWWQEHRALLQISLHPDTARPARWMRLLELGALGALPDDDDPLDEPPPRLLAERPDLHPGESALEAEAVALALGAAALETRADAAGALASLQPGAWLRLDLRRGIVAGPGGEAPLPPRVVGRLRRGAPVEAAVTLPADRDLGALASRWLG